MTRRSITFAALAIALSCLVTTVASADSVDAGKLRIRKSFAYASKTIDEGRFDVRLELGSDSSYIVLSRNGQEIVREMAIVVQRNKSVRRARVGYSLLPAGDNPRLRLAVRFGAELYLAFFMVPE